MSAFIKKDKSMQMLNPQSTLLSTPLGLLKATASDEQITSLCFVEAQTDNQAFINPASELSVFQLLAEELRDYFENKRTSFSIPTAPQGTEFQQNVWRLLQMIPYGATWSYQKLALELGSPKAVRAVAAANAHNPILILIPCHRVIGQDGRLTGYSGNLWRKQRLLMLEEALPQKTLF